MHSRPATVPVASPSGRNEMMTSIPAPFSAVAVASSPGGCSPRQKRKGSRRTAFRIPPRASRLFLQPGLDVVGLGPEVRPVVLHVGVPEGILRAVQQLD